MKHNVWIGKEKINKRVKTAGFGMEWDEIPVVEMSNDDDPYYTQTFRTPEEVDELINELRVAKEICWPKNGKPKKPKPV